MTSDFVSGEIDVSRGAIRDEAISRCLLLLRSRRRGVGSMVVDSRRGSVGAWRAMRSVESAAMSRRGPEGTHLVSISLESFLIAAGGLA